MEIDGNMENNETNENISADNKIICPACGGEMTEISMPKQKMAVDVCVNGCGGIYFDNRELSKLSAPDTDITPIIEVLKNKNFKQINQSEIRKCPVCGADMVKHPAKGNRYVEIDECYTCGGRFLDYQELEKIRAQFNLDEPDADEIMKKLCLDTGIDMLSFRSSGRDWKQGAVKGALLGIAVSFCLLYAYKGALSQMPLNAFYTYSALLTAGICFICAGIGALVSKVCKKAE